jgi:nickel-dependent lactate racemase
MRAILGPASAMFGDRVFFHDADDAANLVAVGSLPDGHVVRINRMAVETDCLILLGAAAYHYHAGFGGGRKSLVPGIAGRDTVAHNHSRTLDPSADRIHPGVGPGLLEGNPVHESMLSAALMRPPAFIVNTVLTPSGELAGVYCGGMVAAHRAACRHVERIERADIRRGADLVVASAEDARDWIQSHKALVNAHRAIRSGGRIVLVAPCPEGLGNERFRHWVRKNTAEAVFRELRNQPEVLGQTALSTIARGAAAVLVTAMRAEDVRDLGIRAVSDFDAALDLVLRELSEEGCERPTCYAMPRGRHCVPFITG